MVTVPVFCLFGWLVEFDRPALGPPAQVKVKFDCDLLGSKQAARFLLPAPAVRAGR